MKTQHIVVTVLVLSVCQWSVLGQSVVTDNKPIAVPAAHPSSVDSPTTVKSTSNETTIAPPITTTTPASTTPNSTTTTSAPTTTTPPTTTPKPTSTTPASSTTTTTQSTTTTTPEPTPAPHGRHFDAPSFIGGIVLTIGLIAIGIVGHKIYKAKFDRNYHTL